MTNVHDCAFLLDFTFENQRIAETQQRTFFVWVFTSKSESLFSANQNRVLTMSSWSRPVKIRGLKSYSEVQLPTVSGNLKKMLYSCLCTSFVSCYCVLTEKIDENGSVVTIDHFSPSPSRITSRLLRKLECVARRIVASHCAPPPPPLPPAIYWHLRIQYSQNV